MPHHNARDSATVKIAVEFDGSNPFLGKLNINHPISGFIGELVTNWNKDTPESWALHFTDKPQHYVTEKNRSRIKDGTVLKFLTSPACTADNILDKLRKKSDTDEMREATEKLLKMSADITFAEEFINKLGIDLLIFGILEDKFASSILGNVLQSFLELMDHAIVSWDNLELSFIQKIASYANASSIDTNVLSTSLLILENIVLSSQNMYTLVEKEITLPNLLRHIQNTGVTTKASQSTKTILSTDMFVIQQPVLALINALFQKADPSKRKYYVSAFSSRHNRQIICNNILCFLEDASSKSQSDREMIHQMYVLQQLLLNYYEDRMRTSLDPRDQDATENIKELRRVAFETDNEVNNKDVTTRRMEIKKEYKKLGFKDDINPAQDFMETPPGMLALDNMIFFARNHPDDYKKLVLENCYKTDSHECPFGRASIELTKLLCEIMKIGHPPNEQGQTFYPMLFTHDHSFEELFCICIGVLNKTWKEMKATTEDFSKVINVVKDQIIRSMSYMLPSLDRFNEKIHTLSYTYITEVWLKERTDHEELEMQAAPIMELRTQLEPEILDLIQRHRFNFLIEGTRFKHKASKGRDKSWYCRLSPNHKFFHYGDCDEKATPCIEELSYKVGVVEIKSLVTGKECPHVKEKATKKAYQMYAFSLLLEGSGNDTRSLDFSVSDETTYYYWLDGINALLRQRMSSKATDDDLKLLLEMEIKLRLLDAEGVTIPQQPPPIPNPPPNYNFCYLQT